MAIVQEFANGVILYGLREVHPEQRSDSEDSDNHTTDAEDSFGSVSPDDTQNNFQAEVEPQLPKEVEIPKVQEEQPQEHHHQPQCMLELLNSCDPQLLQEEAEAKGNPSGEAQNSESDQSDHEPKHFAVSPAPVPVPQLPWDVLPPGSKAKGVTYHINIKQWEAHLWIPGRHLRNRKKKGVQIFAGSYSTEDEAKRAHDRAAIKFDVRTSGRSRKPYRLNFHESAQAEFIAEHQDWSPRDFVWKLRRYSLKFSSGKSNLKGVTVRKSSRKRKITRGEDSEPGSGETSVTLRYEARITKTDGKKTTSSLGTYGSEEEAGKAYDRALLFINKDKDEVEQWHVITNFRPSNYTEEEISEAGKKLV